MVILVSSDSLLITADGIGDTLNHLDRLLPYYRPQIAVVYVDHGQSDWLKIFDNAAGSARFHQFVTSLGEQTSLKKSEHNLEHNILISGLEYQKHGLFTIVKDDDAMKIQDRLSSQNFTERLCKICQKIPPIFIG